MPTNFLMRKFAHSSFVGQNQQLTDDKIYTKVAKSSHQYFKK